MNRTSLDRNLEYAPYNIIVAEVRFRNSIQHLMQVFEEKQNFNPSRPRHPKGNPTGGHDIAKGQAIQIAAAKRYAEDAGVILVIEYAR